MATKIDWDTNIKQISSAYNLTDKQVKEGLSAINHAHDLYDRYENDDIPECILLYDNNNNVIHKIKTFGGKPCTVEVRPKKDKIKIVFAIALCSSFAVMLFYFYKMTK